MISLCIPLLSSRDGALLECTFQGYKFSPSTSDHPQSILLLPRSDESERRNRSMLSTRKRLALTVSGVRHVYLHYISYQKDSSGNTIVKYMETIRPAIINARL
jgi:hypothetical protein